MRVPGLEGALVQHPCILSFSDFDEPETWRPVLEEHLINMDFRVFPDIGDPEDIRHALIWNPAPDFFEPFKKSRTAYQARSGSERA